MGNCLARRKHMVHPSEPYHPTSGSSVMDRSPPSDALRITVRMTSAEFKQLVSGADDGEIGRLIFQECLKGRFRARVISCPQSKADHGKVRSLEAISEEEE